MEGLTGPVSNPTVSPRSNVRRFVTTAAGTPGVVARAQGATGAEVEVRGPSGSWTSYEATVCNLRTSACKAVPCARAPQDPTTCSITGLEDGCPFSVQVRGVPLAAAMTGWWAAPCCRPPGVPGTPCCHALLEHSNRRWATSSKPARPVHNHAGPQQMGTLRPLPPRRLWR